MRISLVTPLYRSAPYVEELHRRAVETITKITDDYEIIFVNDGSPDDSLSVAKRVAERDPRVTVIDLSRNFGQHPALITGLRASTGDYVFICDSDLEEHPEWIQAFYHELKSKSCDVVYGVQTAKKGSLFYRFGRHLFYSSVRFISGIDFPENVTTARLMTRRYVNAMLEYKERALSIVGIWHVTGFQQMPYKVAKVDRSPTTYNFTQLLALFIHGVTAFSTRPLHVISLTGLLIAAFAIFFIAWLIWRKLAFDIEVEGWTSVMATTLLLGGVTIFFVGILAIYLATVFIEVKQRPLTTIREIINEYRNTIETDKSSVSSYGCHSIFKPDRMAIVRHHERCLGRPGEASHADDPKSEELDRIRYDAMLGLLMHETERVTLLDFGCGQGDLKHHIDRKGLIHIQYEGLEISSAFAEAARRRFPQVTIRCVDVLKGEIILPQYDYIVMNGIFTRRDELSEPEMFAYLESLVSRLFRHAKRGLAFNVMSPIADRKNESLFHPSFDAIAAIITRSISRNLVLRNDYGLRECTCYIYRETRAR